jgi:C4-dicarboxylate-specific signal transduction histidine kinase
VVRSKRPPYRSGEWFEISSRGKVVERDAGGRATRIMGIHEDATEAMLKAKLEREREEALAHTTRMASLGALATSLAHEINQPLTALTSFLETSQRLLDNGADRQEVAAALSRSLELADRASEIVRRMRRLLRRGRPLLERVELPAALHAACDHLEREARAAGVVLRVEDEIQPTAIRGDRVQIGQALVNLVRNAIEALAGVDHEPRVVVLDAVREGDMVEVLVADNGPGLHEQVAERIFEPFFTTKSGGTGLGLVFCESIAEVHGGHVRLRRSGPGGTTFALILPASNRDSR